MVNPAFAGLVVDCDDHMLKLYHEKVVYKVERKGELLKKQKGSWVWFKLDEENPLQVTQTGDMPNYWKSRLSPEGEILLELHAVIRNEREFPDIEGATFPAKPWSCQVDFLNDPEEKFSYKRGYRKGRMHDVTVKVVVNNDDVSFDIIQVEYESAPEIQLEMGYSPWVYYRLLNLPPREGSMEDKKSLARNRQLGKVHEKSKDFGVLVRKTNGETFIWSNDSGLIFVEEDHNFQVGDFIQFRRFVRKLMGKMVAKNLERGQVVVARTREVSRWDGLSEALVEIRLLVPKNQDFYKNSVVTQCDPFYGKVTIPAVQLCQMLQEKNVSMEEAYGRWIWAWAAPANMSSGRFPSFWVIEELCDNSLDLDEVDYLCTLMKNLNLDSDPDYDNGNATNSEKGQFIQAKETESRAGNF